MKRLVLALLLLLPAAPLAADCRVVNRQRIIKVDAVLATYYAPVAAYGPAYVGGVSDADRIAALERKIDELLRLLAARGQGARQTGEHVGAFTRNCAACHSTATSSKGADFAILDSKTGDVVEEFDVLQLAKMSAYVATGHMPKGAKMSPDDQRICQAWLKQMLDSVKEKK